MVSPRKRKGLYIAFPILLVSVGVFLNGAGVEVLPTSDRRILTYRPALGSFHLYRTITSVDGSLTRMQQFQGLLGTTLADFQLVPKSSEGGVFTVSMNIHNYNFQAREFQVGSGAEGTGREAPGAGGAGGGEGGGGGGGGSPGPYSLGLASGQTIIQVGSLGSGEPGPGIGPGPGGPAAPGRERGGAPSEEESPTRLELSKLLQREWQLVINPHYEILGTRGADFRRIRDVSNISAVGMDQIMELAFIPYLPDAPVAYGDSWRKTKPFTLLGIRTPVQIDLKYTIHPRIDINTACRLDSVICEMLGRGRPYLSLVLRRILGLPGFAPYDTYSLAGVFASGSTDFDSSETEEIIDQEGGYSYAVERTFRGRAHLSALFLYDVNNNSLHSLAVSQYVQYYRKVRRTDLAEIAEAEGEEQEPALEYFNYILDTDLLRATYQRQDLSTVVTVGR